MRYPFWLLLIIKAIAETQTLSLQLDATDANSDRLTYTATNLPAGATLDPVTIFILY